MGHEGIPVGRAPIFPAGIGFAEAAVFNPSLFCTACKPAGLMPFASAAAGTVPAELHRAERAVEPAERKTRRFSPVILHVSAFPGVPAAKTPCPRKLGMKAPPAAEGSCV